MKRKAVINILIIGSILLIIYFFIGQVVGIGVGPRQLFKTIKEQA